MENVWKITNSGKVNSPIKTTVRIENTRTIAVLIGPGEFVLAMPFKTAQLDAQSLKRGLLNIDKEFDNSYFNLELGKVYKEGAIDEVRKSI